MTTAAAAEKVTLQTICAALESLKQNNNSVNEQSLIKLSTHLNELSQMLAGLGDMGTAWVIEEETIQFIVDCTELKIEGIVKNTVTSIPDTIAAYKQNIAFYLAEINSVERLSITLLIGAIVGAVIFIGLTFGTGALGVAAIGGVLGGCSAMWAYDRYSTSSFTKVNDKVAVIAEEGTKLKNNSIFQ